MLEALKDIGEYDVLFFFPTDKEDTLKIEAALYKEPGEKIGGSELGSEYTIMLFKFDEEDGAYDYDTFDAILADPRIYISNLIPQQWYGFVARKTTKSKKFVDDIIAKIKDI
jgi:hypothetical protein